MTEPMAGLIQVLKKDGVKLDNAVPTTCSFRFGKRKIQFTKTVMQFQVFQVFISQGGVGLRKN